MGGSGPGAAETSASAGPEAPGRLFLHADRLEFTHPASGERLAFEASLPEELRRYLELLRQG